MTGQAVLGGKNGISIKATAIDISEGGFGVAVSETKLTCDEYTIDITTGRGRIHCTAELIHQSEESAGFRITRIDRANFKKIVNLVTDFQSTEEFIKHVDEHDLLDDWLRDDEGNEVQVTFDEEGA